MENLIKVSKLAKLKMVFLLLAVFLFISSLGAQKVNAVSFLNDPFSTLYEKKNREA